MLPPKGIVEALEYGLKQENAMRGVYEMAAARVDSKELRALFLKIAKDEVRHAKLVRGLLGDLTGEPYTGNEYKAEEPEEGKLEAWELENFLETNTAREREVEKYYAEFIIRGKPPDSVREVVETLSNESEGHAQLLESAADAL
jgi:rubrerythrin